MALQVSLPLLPTHHTVCWHDSVLRARRARFAGNNSIQPGKWNLRDYGLCHSLPSRYMQTGRQPGRQTDRQTRKRAIRQADRQTNTLQAGRSADWRTDRHTDRYIRPQQFSLIKQHLMLVVKIKAVRVKRRPWISKAEHLEKMYTDLWWGEKLRHSSQCL